MALANSIMPLISRLWLPHYSALSAPLIPAFPKRALRTHHSIRASWTVWTAPIISPSHFADFDDFERSTRHHRNRGNYEDLLRDFYDLPEDHIGAYADRYDTWCRAIKSSECSLATLLQRDWRDPLTVFDAREITSHSPWCWNEKFGGYGKDISFCVRSVRMTPSWLLPDPQKDYLCAHDIDSKLLFTSIELTAPLEQRRQRGSIAHLSWASHATTYAPPPGYNTRLFHLRRIEEREVTRSPYCAVAQISNAGTGTIDGIFAFSRTFSLAPTRHRKIERHDSTWAPPSRGVYYLGQDLEDVCKRRS